MGASGSPRLAPRGPARSAPSAGSARAYALVTGALLVLFLAPLTFRGFRLPVGADVPYYVWSTRLAGEVGLSVTDFRPGLHALLLAVSRSTGLSSLQAVGALAVAVAAGLGLAAAVLADRGFGRDPVRSGVVGVTVGAFAAHLTAGFLANLLFGLLFVAALAALVGRVRRAPAVFAGLLLGAAGLAHGLFLVVGAAVLGGAAVLRASLAGGHGTGVRTDIGRLGGAALTGGAVAGVGFFTASLGQPLSDDERAHTRDELLRRSGLAALVEGAYLSRWRAALSSFAAPVTAPLAAIGAAAMRANALLDPLFASLLGSWAVVTVAGIVAGLTTSRLPAARVLNFSLVLPLLGGAGIVVLARWLEARRRRLGVVVGALLLAAMLFGPARAWARTHPFTSPTDLGAVRAAAETAVRLPPGTPLVYVVDHHGPHAGFELSRVVNVIRMGLPAERQRDVLVFVGGPHDYAARRPGLTGDPEHDGIAWEQFDRAAPVLDEPHAAFLVRPLAQPVWDGNAGDEVHPLVRVLARPADAPAVAPTQAVPDNDGLPPWLLPPLAVGLLALLALAGAGWVRLLAPALDRPETWALAPAAGAGAAVLAGVALDATGLRLDPWGGAAMAAAVAGSAAGWVRAERAARR